MKIYVIFKKKNVSFSISDCHFPVVVSISRGSTLTLSCRAGMSIIHQDLPVSVSYICCVLAQLLCCAWSWPCPFLYKARHLGFPPLHFCMSWTHSINSHRTGLNRLAVPNLEESEMNYLAAVVSRKDSWVLPSAAAWAAFSLCVKTGK